MTVFGHGAAHTNGTRLFWKPPPNQRVGTGAYTARPGLAVGDVPPFVLERRPGACARPGVDPRWFEPSFGEDPNNWHTVGKARAVCKVCPVRAECLAWAIGDKRLDGMYGGTTPAERTELRRTA